jgi:hypothetical protein
MFGVLVVVFCSDYIAGLGLGLGSIPELPHVVKVRSCPVIIFPPKDDPTCDCRSVQFQ